MTSEAARILRRRAEALARRPPAPEEGRVLEVLEFTVGGESYALETRHVREAHPLRDLAPLPSVPPFVRGIVHLRGRFLAVYDLPRLFGLPEQGITDLHRIVIVQGAGLELGLLADTIASVRRIPMAGLQPGPEGGRPGYLLGIAPGRVAVLDIDAILRDPALIVHQDADN